MPADQAAATGAETEKKSESGREYVVRAGDTLGAIAAQHQVDLDSLMADNGLTTSDIHPDQILKLPARPGTGKEHRVEPGDTAWDIAQQYGISMAQLSAANGGTDLELLQVDQIIRLPVGAGAGQAVALPDRSFLWPVLGPITSSFGPRWGRHHDGIDIAADQGVPIRSARDGVVVSAGWVSGYGKTAIVRHGPELRTLYAHASEILVQAGQAVKAGQVIGRVGSTGHSTGPHLHFEIIAGRPVNPLGYLPPLIVRQP